jgi:hypothetical protein
MVHFSTSARREYGVPLTPPPVVLPGSEYGAPDKALHPNAVRRAALALANHSDTMPQPRRTELQARSLSLPMVPSPAALDNLN